MRSSILTLAALAAIAAGNNPYYSVHRNRRTGEYKPRDNARTRSLYKVNMTQHEFNIHGEIIMATNRKTALKIYANRHKKK